MALVYSGKVITKARIAVWNTYPHVCHLCGKQIASFEEYEPDHLIPRSQGGSPLDIANMRPSHGTKSKQRCNQRRGTKTIAKYTATQPLDNTEWFIPTERTSS